MDILQWNDLAVIGAITLAIVIPELIVGFERWKALTRLGILAACCLVATFLAYYLQAHVDPGAAFTRAFLIAITSRIILTMNHIAQAQKERAAQEAQ